MIKIIALLAGLVASVYAKAADSSSPNALATVEDLLKQEHQHARSTVPPKSLAEFESEALVSNPEIQASAMMPVMMAADASTMEI